MAKSQVKEVETSGNGNGATPVAPKVETVAQIADRFSQETANLSIDATIRDLFAYADSSVTFGNGQWTAVPCHFDRFSLDTGMAILAMALETSRLNGAGTMDDDSLGAIVAKAEANFDVGKVLGSLLEEAVDSYFYGLQKMSKDERKAAGVTKFIPADKTSFAKRRRYALGVLNFPASGERIVDESTFAALSAAKADTLSDEDLAILRHDRTLIVEPGFPQAGRRWVDVVRDAIRSYCTDSSGKKKVAKEPDEKTVSTNGRARVDTNSVDATFN